jgi:hypothetical protein
MSKPSQGNRGSKPCNTSTTNTDLKGWHVDLRVKYRAMNWFVSCSDEA